MMTTKIIKALEISYKQYNDYRFNSFIGWCIKWAEISTIPLEYLIKNNHLTNWYLTAWHNMVEKPFVAELRPYLEEKITAPNTYLDLLDKYIDEIDNFHPEQLLTLIQNNYDKTPHSKKPNRKTGIPVIVKYKPEDMPTYHDFTKRNKKS